MPRMSADATAQTGIQYAATADGVRVAVRLEGDGQPVVYMPMAPWYGIRVAPESSEGSTPAPEALHRVERMVLHYDVRGMGLSAGPALDLSLHAQLLDLAAVIDHAEAQRVSLVAPVHSAPAAIAYSEKHPDRISHLVLWCGYARGADFFGRTRIEAVRHILADDWELFTENLAVDIVGWDEPGAARALASLVRDNFTPETAIAALTSLLAIDVAPIRSLTPFPDT